MKQMPPKLEGTNATLHPLPTPVEQGLLVWKVTDYYYGELSIFLIALNYLNAQV